MIRNRGTAEGFRSQAGWGKRSPYEGTVMADACEDGRRYIDVFGGLNPEERAVSEFLDAHYPAPDWERVMASGKELAEGTVTGHSVDTAAGISGVYARIHPDRDPDRVMSKKLADEIAEVISSANDPALTGIRQVVLDTTFVVNTGDVSIDGEPLIDVPLATTEIPRAR